MHELLSSDLSKAQLHRQNAETELQRQLSRVGDADTRIRDAVQQRTQMEQMLQVVQPL